MIGFAIFLILITWLALQGRASRQPVWERRWSRVAEVFGPIARYVAADLRAVRLHMSTYRIRRQFKKGL